MRIGVLAVQGAFIEHRNILEKIGIETFEIRQKSDLLQPFHGIILPGGESTVQGKLMRELDLFDPIQKEIENGLPVMGTCAGLILLAEKLYNDDTVHLQTLPVVVKRNAYGRQLGSFYAEEQFEGIGTVPMKFIRAPYIESVNKEVKILSKVDEKIVAVSYKNQLGLSFHPELCQGEEIHRYFIEKMV